MNTKIVHITALLICAVSAGTSQTITGQWTISSIADRDQAQLTIERNGSGFNMTNSSPIPLTELRGLARPQLESAGAMAQFELIRDAGTLYFEGYVKSGGGGGVFRFLPDPKFAAAMGAVGFPNIPADDVFSMAVHDVSATYVQDLNASGIRPDSPKQLITMRIHGVTAEYVRDLKGLGFSGLRPDNLVTLRIHGITPEYIRKAKSRVAGDLSIDQLVRLKIHGILD